MPTTSGSPEKGKHLVVLGPIPSVSRKETCFQKGNPKDTNSLKELVPDSPNAAGGPSKRGELQGVQLEL